MLCQEDWPSFWNGEEPWEIFEHECDEIKDNRDVEAGSRQEKGGDREARKLL